MKLQTVKNFCLIPIDCVDKKYTATDTFSVFFLSHKNKFQRRKSFAKSFLKKHFFSKNQTCF